MARRLSQWLLVTGVFLLALSTSLLYAGPIPATLGPCNTNGLCSSEGTVQYGTTDPNATTNGTITCNLGVSTGNRDQCDNTNTVACTFGVAISRCTGKIPGTTTNCYALYHVCN
jgi:hypothetical protein